MRVALTGASGLVGRFIARAATAAGHEVDPLPGWRLGRPAPLEGCDALVHAAFAHVPGRYRGGEGDDPAAFVAANLDGSVALFEQARRAGVRRVVFLSSRAVFDRLPPGTPLPDGTAPDPASLYGQVKAQAEAALAGLRTPDFATASLRPTGIYGPGPGHKWTGLFADYLAGRKIAPRVATELHGDDLAQAVLLILAAQGAPGQGRGAFNASDIVLDRHDLLAEVARLAGARHPLPPRADASAVSVMCCARLAALGWRPGGLPLLRRELPTMFRVPV
ncbi:NAD-dependent epimerase/dehydratase family protein [Paracoccus aeridis]|uniref:NAD-dependent epimerase/dehydratase family protein n=1 Tax=Paracoccus aeridis TaxID=1966466 RepID=UPI0010A9EDDF|nr:NAD(P)-dependent oxidoreductase [Paracoccus aeridis]